MPRFALTAGLALALAFVPTASSGVRSSGVVAGVPSALHAFLLRSDEPVAHEYPRTPSFAWTPSPQRGGHYQFELATSQRFQDGSIVFKDTKVLIPAETISRQLPWMVGQPYALWAHVRWMADNGMSATRWSTPFGFNMRWLDQDVPQQWPAPEGLIRWKPVQGATSYEVLYIDIHPSKSFQTTTNVADEREFFTFHSNLGYTMPIRWRVRAIRDVSRTAPPTNGLPPVSYGPWSPVFTSQNTPQTLGTSSPTDTVSDAWGKTKLGHQFHLTPGFAWNPEAQVVTDGIDAGSALYRVYIFTDNHCVNRIFTGSIVGSPAWAPRTIGGPINLPSSSKELDRDKAGRYPGAGSEGTAIDPAGSDVKAAEGIAPKGSGTAPSSSGSSSAASSASSSSTSSSTTAQPVANVDLWDSGWPTGRYYWTVVPVTVFNMNDDPTASDLKLGYQDAAVPQDACESGSIMGFGKVSRPVVTTAGKPFVSGVAPTGRTVAAVGQHAEVYASPIVAWQPAVGATTYQVELSRTLYPWHATKGVRTPATSVLLPLTKFNAGTWFYRVRGINEALPVGARAMTWSPIVRIKITGDRFKIVS
jgi:hypothetical protein